MRLADHQLLSLRQVRSQSPGVQTSWELMLGFRDFSGLGIHHDPHNYIM